MNREFEYYKNFDIRVFEKSKEEVSEESVNSVLRKILNGSWNEFRNNRNLTNLLKTISGELPF